MEPPLKTALKQWCELLQKHGGRDKVVRISGYICTVIADFPGVRDGPLCDKLRIVGKQLSLTRTTMRLFDDLVMLNSTLNYGWGSGETDTIKRISMLLSNLINTCYYPVEHLAWASDRGLIKLDSSPLWKITSYCWATTTYLGIVRTVRTISALIHHKQHILKQAEGPTEADIKQYQRAIIQEVFTLVQQCSDLGMAVNGLPGLLWGGKLKPRHSGFLGIISSLIAILKLLNVVP